MPSRGQQPVGLRLALAFVAVAVLAVALVAVLAVLFTGKDIAVLVQQRRDDLIRSLAADAVSTYETRPLGWFNIYLRPALDLAASDGAPAAIFDGRGTVVTSTLATATGPQGSPAAR